MLRLSRRMQLIFDLLLPDKPVWDFCCDHGYMGLNAYESGRFSEIFFVDKVPHIIEQLRSRFLKEYFTVEHKTKTYFLADPGEEILRPLYGTMIVAGVGAHTIYKIVESLHQKNILHADRLILGPQKDEEKLQKMLMRLSEFNYKTSEKLVEVVERGRSRRLLIFDKI
ncbi:MAG: SAM-dependent methyltransferase [Bdellovibrio sp.]